MSLRFRQIHLDFHTGPEVPDVGADFDPEEFAATLEAAHVNSVTCFARCHHGFIYYQSAAHPERVHPHLVRRDLLVEQIEACHHRGIRVPIYTTVEWDEYTADRHRDWLLIDENGCEFGTKPLEAGFYRFLDVLHPGYLAFLKDHVADIFRTVPVDGLFFDICIPRPSLALHWIEAMDAAGVDPENPQARMAFARRVMDEFMLDMSAFVRSQPGWTPECTIFYNSGHVGPRHRSSMDAFTHYELESLPSGGWGYLHFPLTQRYVRGLGKPTLGMTGKFHTSWGDFHSYKNPAALEFETRHMIALGAHCSIGDQLHPRGKLEPATYELIGRAYEEIEAREPWCEGAVPISEIGVLTPEEFALRRQSPEAWEQRLPEAAMGALRMLQEMHAQFDIISSDRDFSAYRLLILPDCIPLDGDISAKLASYVERGGAVILSAESLLDGIGNPTTLPWLPAYDTGPAPFEPDFVAPGPELRAAASPELRETAYVMYRRGRLLAPASGSTALAQVHKPYFNRHWRHFCSHRHTPSSGEVAYPAVVRLGRVICFAHPVFTTYQEMAPLWCRSMLSGAVRLLLPDPVAEVGGPSSLIASLTEQPSLRRKVLHLLHYVPERRGQAFDVVEDVLPVYDVACSVNAPGTSEVRLVPDGQPLSFALEGGRVRFTVPVVRGHAMVELR
ncbi:MAG: beta-galactosidase [Chthonomonadales bacterium]|nr:beta-galactosidase [Chthonomonadales bacterium]